MIHTPPLTPEFYQRLGHLFYATAAIDNRIEMAELSKLHQRVQDTWLTLDDVQDEFGEDAAYQIEIVFNWLQDHVHDAQESFEAFVDYYKAHKTLFTPSKKRIITKTVKSIASSFAGLNKSELGLMGRLAILFES